ncbi:MAG: RNA-binding protein [Methylovirgula sp.]
MAQRTKPESERTCIVTKTKAGPNAMLRFVVGPGGEVVADLRLKLPGRGLWVTGRADMVAAAVKGRAFPRGFKAEVKVSATLPAEIEALLVENCLQALSIGKKAGQVITGFFKVETAINAGGVIGLVHASDGGADGSRKLSQALRRFGQSRPEIKLFTSLQLSLALGGTNVIHAALTEGAASEVFLSHCRKLERYRSTPSASSDAGALEAADGAIC